MSHLLYLSMVGTVGTQQASAPKRRHQNGKAPPFRSTSTPSVDSLWTVLLPTPSQKRALAWPCKVLVNIASLIVFHRLFPPIFSRSAYQRRHEKPSPPQTRFLIDPFSCCGSGTTAVYPYRLLLGSHPPSSSTSPCPSFSSSHLSPNETIPGPGPRPRLLLPGSTSHQSVASID